MIIRLIYSSIYVSFIATVCSGQVKFFEHPKIFVNKDTTYYELNHKYFYDYFSQSYDSVLVDFNVYFDKPYYQVAATSNYTGDGYYIVKDGHKLLQYYQIHNNKIEGIGIIYYGIYDDSCNLIVRQGTFKNNRLDGVEMFFDNSTGIIYRVGYYKKGKFKRYLYDYENYSKYKTKTY